MKRLYRKLILCLILIPMLSVLSASRSLAHKVDLFLSAKDGVVYTESYYPDGTKVQNGIIEVFDSQDNKLLEGSTGSEGLFSFKIPKIDDLRIVLDAKMGHKTSSFIFVEELEAGSKAGGGEHSHGSETHTHETEAALSKPNTGTPRVRKEPFPVAAVLGGLGFIFGLTALIMQFSNKNKG